MALYELTDAVKNNILTLISKAPITGGEAPAIIEIADALETPAVIQDPVSSNKKDGKK